MMNFKGRAILSLFCFAAFAVAAGAPGCYYDRLVAGPAEQAPTDSDADSDTDADMDAGSDSDADTETAECPPIPAKESESPPDESDSCAGLDWAMSPDGFYLISWFGTSADTGNVGGTTTCGQLQDHYDSYECVYDNHSSSCVDSEYAIPNIQGNVDYIYEDVEAAVDQYAPGDVPTPEYFYIAGAQRFGCGSLLRVSNLENDRCVVVYVEDSGPSYLYETVDYGGRRILNASPAVHLFLDITNTGWASSDLVYVEWGEDGDVPGHVCAPCQSTAAKAGTEDNESIFDPNHMLTDSDCG